MQVTGDSFKEKSNSFLEVFMSHSFIVPSTPPDATHRLSGLKRTMLTWPLWPLNVCMQFFRRRSHIFRLQSEDPVAKKVWLADG